MQYVKCSTVMFAASSSWTRRTASRSAPPAWRRTTATRPCPRPRWAVIGCPRSRDRSAHSHWSQVTFRVPLGGPGTAVAGGSGWLEGIMGCFKPVWAIMGKNKPTDAERGEDTAQHYWYVDVKLVSRRYDIIGIVKHMWHEMNLFMQSKYSCSNVNSYIKCIKNPNKLFSSVNNERPWKWCKEML